MVAQSAREGLLEELANLDDGEPDDEDDREDNNNDGEENDDEESDTMLDMAERLLLS